MSLGSHKLNLQRCTSVGKADNNTPCHGYHRTLGGTFAYQFWSIRQDGDNQSYTLRNLRSATYLDLISGRALLRPFIFL